VLNVREVDVTGLTVASDLVRGRWILYGRAVSGAGALLGWLNIGRSRRALVIVMMSEKGK
jgi:hypothetical protein